MIGLIVVDVVKVEALVGRLVVIVELVFGLVVWLVEVEAVKAEVLELVVWLVAGVVVVLEDSGKLLEMVAVDEVLGPGVTDTVAEVLAE